MGRGWKRSVFENGAVIVWSMYVIKNETISFISRKMFDSVENLPQKSITEILKNEVQ